MSDKIIQFDDAMFESKLDATANLRKEAGTTRSVVFFHAEFRMAVGYLRSVQQIREVVDRCPQRRKSSAHYGDGTAGCAPRPS